MEEFKNNNNLGTKGTEQTPTQNIISSDSDDKFTLDGTANSQITQENSIQELEQVGTQKEFISRKQSNKLPIIVVSILVILFVCFLGFRQYATNLLSGKNPKMSTEQKIEPSISTTLSDASSVNLANIGVNIPSGFSDVSPDKNNLMFIKKDSQNTVIISLALFGPAAESQSNSSFTSTDSYKAFLKVSKVKFWEDTVDIGGINTVAIYTGLTGDESNQKGQNAIPFYSTLITYKNNFYLAELTVKNKTNIEQNKKTYGEFLGSIKLQ